MVHHPSVYAKLLGEKIEKHNVNCWLVNTGWTGGAYGEGSRMKISYTRRMVDELLSGSLGKVEYEIDPVFGLHIPKTCPGVPTEVLNPRNTWKDKQAYDVQARKLAGMFQENFKLFEDGVPEEVLAAGPKAK